jgi:hypothetical protein
MRLHVSQKQIEHCVMSRDIWNVILYLLYYSNTLNWQFFEDYRVILFLLFVSHRFMLYFVFPRGIIS